jgi:hypothetical protein
MTKVEDVAISRMAYDGCSPAAVERSYVAPFERLDLGLEVSALSQCIRCWQMSKNRKCESEQCNPGKDPFHLLSLLKLGRGADTHPTF